LKIKINKRAYKDLKNIDKNDAVKILKEIVNLKHFPNVSNIKRLSHFKPSFRKRIGNYRALFEIENEIIIIYRILHRKESYK